MAVAAIPYIMMAMAAAMAAVSSIQQGAAQDKLAKHNASLLEQQANNTRAWANYNADRQREKANRLNANAEAGFAANGMDGTFGSPLAILADNEGQAELENLAIRTQGENDARVLQGQANAARFQGQVAKQASYMKAGSSLLQMGGSMAGAYGAMGSGAGAGVGSSTFGVDNMSSSSGTAFT